MKRQFSMIPSCVVVVLAVLILLWAPALALAKPPPKEGNPGVPGLLYEIEKLEATIEEQAERIEELEARPLVLGTGQTDCYDEDGQVVEDCDDPSVKGQDGDIQYGVQWPVPRFTDKGDGTVKDNLTGLIWLQKSNCFGSTELFTDALNHANTLYDADEGDLVDDCDLRDGSMAGDWRLPNINELISLSGFVTNGGGVSNAQGNGSCVPGDCPFDDPYPGDRWYWSSTSNVGDDGIWIVKLEYVATDIAPWDSKDGGVAEGWGGLYVWPVRGGQ